MSTQNPSKSNYATLRKETKKMLSGGEFIDVEYKKSIGGLDPEDLVAFANASGGTILVGVSEYKDPTTGLQYGVIVGCDVSDRARTSIISRANSCQPPVQVDIVAENVKKKPIFRVDISEATRKPCCTSGCTYKIRVSGANIGVDPELMTSLIIQREEKEFLKRFREAGESIIREIGDVESKLSKMIEDAIDAADAVGTAISAGI